MFQSKAIEKVQYIINDSNSKSLKFSFKVYMVNQFIAECLIQRKPMRYFYDVFVSKDVRITVM